MPRPILAAIALLAVSAGFTACGDDDAAPTSQPTEQPTSTTPAEDTVTPTPVAATTISITIKDFSFDPASFTIPAGQVVAFALDNSDPSAHTFTVYTDAEFTSAQGTTLPMTGDTADTVFGTFDPGTYYFRCDVHPQNMQGSFTAE